MTRRRILIVEDEPGVAHALKRALELAAETQRYQVETCASAEEALEFLRGNPVTLLVTDFRLPGMNGDELLLAARQIQPDVLSVLVTAYDNPELEQQASMLANGYLPKPFLLRDMLSTIQGVLQQAPVEVSPIAPEPVPAPEKFVSAEVERRRHTYLKVLATDYDGTLARDNLVSPQSWELLRQVKRSGYALILVTGRILDTILDTGPFNELFEVIVAENGAVVYYPKTNQVKLPFGRIAPAMLHHLEETGIPLERGLGILATRVPHDVVMMRVMQEQNLSATIEYNCGAVMLLPPGATKGTGLAFAMHELGFSEHNLVAVGDAENDFSLLKLAELAVAVPHALPRLKAVADLVLTPDPLDPGTGINQLLLQLLSRRGPEHVQRPERRIVLGYTRDGETIHLDPVNLIDSRIGIFGNSHSGKSWLSGLLTEEMLRLDYQVCLVDPEGDYSTLAASNHCLHLGLEGVSLPAISDLTNLLEWHGVSIILSLVNRSPEVRMEYVSALVCALRGVRSRRGRPHWILIDEAHYFCPREGSEMTDLLLKGRQEGLSFGVVSYQPSQVSPGLLENLDSCLVTRLSSQEEVQSLTPFLNKNNKSEYLPGSLGTLPVGQAYLCSNVYRPLTVETRSPVRFQVGPRAIPHIRHLQKYLRAPLPPGRRFYFTAPNGVSLGFSAASLWEFKEMLGTIPLDSLKYHQQRGDFERWIQKTLGDNELAAQVHKLSAGNGNAEILRQALRELVTYRYDELDVLV